MRPQPGRTKLGVLAVAFDAAGREILSALADRPGAPQVDVECVHAVEDEDGKIAWLRRASGGSWRKPDWSASAPRLETGLEAAVRGMLDVERWQTPGGGLDLLDLLLVSPGPEPASGALPKETLAALKKLRRRYKKISTHPLPGRRHLRNRRRGRPCRTRQPPALRRRIGRRLLRRHPPPRPHQYREYGHQRRREGFPTRLLPESFHHLTTGELAPVLFRRIQAEQARFGSAGRYVSLGFTEWRLTSELGIQATSGALYRNMAERLDKALSAPYEERGGGARRPVVRGGLTRDPRRPPEIGPDSFR